MSQPFSTLGLAPQEWSGGSRGRGSNVSSCLADKSWKYFLLFLSRFQWKCTCHHYRVLDFFHNRAVKFIWHSGPNLDRGLIAEAANSTEVNDKADRTTVAVRVVKELTQATITRYLSCIVGTLRQRSDRGWAALNPWMLLPTQWFWQSNREVLQTRSGGESVI